MDPKKILVTGSGGLLGSSLVPHLKSLGYVVEGTERSGTRLVDLEDGESVRSWLSLHKPQGILNLAALAQVDLCETDVNRAYRLNVRLPALLSDWICENSPSTKMIHISTDMVYDGGDEPHIESDVCPRNVYALSKLGGETEALRCGSLVFRTNFFGHSKTPKKKSFTDWVLGELRKKAEISLFSDSWVSFIEIESLCEHLGLVLKKTEDAKIFGVFNLGTREGLSKADFVIALADFVDYPIRSHMKIMKSTDFGFKARRPQNMRMDVSKFEKTFEVKLPNLKEQLQRWCSPLAL